MTHFDDNPEDRPGSPSRLPDSPTEPQPLAPLVQGDPFAFGTSLPVDQAPVSSERNLPDDLRISWSWLHLVMFLIFGVASLITIQAAVVVYYTANHHLTEDQLKKLFIDKPLIAVGTNVLWYAVVFLFLYVTIAVLRNLPFWRSLGWRRLIPTEHAPANPWLYFFAGSGLAVCVAIASAKVRTPDNMPIQQMFSNRTGAILIMSMAVFVAPLVEETIFRGYLYPLVAKSFGMLPGILVTGFLFGLMHGAQLGWAWGLVGMLIIVGWIFTFARARSGTVVASFLMHLGYNSFLAVSTIIATRGFTHIPIKP